MSCYINELKMVAGRDRRLSKWSRLDREDIFGAAVLRCEEELSVWVRLMHMFPVLGANGEPLKVQPPKPKLCREWQPRSETIADWVRKALCTARKNFRNRQARFVNLDPASLERVSVRIERRQTVEESDDREAFEQTSMRRLFDATGEASAIDTDLSAAFSEPRRWGKNATRSDWQDAYFDGRRPHFYRAPTTREIPDAAMRATVCRTEGEKIRVAETPNRRMVQPGGEGVMRDVPHKIGER